MKVLKIFLSLIVTAIVGCSLFAMEVPQKPAEIQKRKEGQPITTDELRTILNLVMATIKSSKITEADLFDATNKLRLVNKKFNSLIQEYIDAKKKLKPKKYANLTKAQEYKQFQLDLIEEKINEFVRSRGTVHGNELMSYVINDLEAFKWLENQMQGKYILKDRNLTKVEDIKYGHIEDFKYDYAVKNIFDQKIQELSNLKWENLDDFNNIIQAIENYKTLNTTLAKKIKSLSSLYKLFMTLSEDDFKRIMTEKIFNVNPPYSSGLKPTIEKFFKLDLYDWLNNDPAGKKLVLNYLIYILDNANLEELKNILTNEKLTLPLNFSYQQRQEDLLKTRRAKRITRPYT